MYILCTNVHKFEHSGDKVADLHTEERPTSKFSFHYFRPRIIDISKRNYRSG